MAFLGSLGKVFHDVVHNPVFQAVFPVVAIANLAAEKVISRAVDRPNFVSTGKPVSSAREIGGARVEYAPYGSNYGPEMPFSGYSFGGGAWDSSMGLETRWQTWEPPTFQAVWTQGQNLVGEDSQAISWEDSLRATYSQSLSQ